jgi:hypothetical protein
MSNQINKDTQLDVSYKESQSIGFTDTDKSNFEESHSFNHLIDSTDVFVDEITHNDPAASVAAFTVASGLVQLAHDETSGDKFRVYYLSGITNIILPKKYGNNYAPIFYDGSMNEIYDGDFYTYSTIDWKNAYISIERNATTDTWHDPIYFDGFWYIGRTLADITIGGGGEHPLAALSHVVLDPELVLRDHQVLAQRLEPLVVSEFFAAIVRLGAR